MIFSIWQNTNVPFLLQPNFLFDLTAAFDTVDRDLLALSGAAVWSTRYPSALVHVVSTGQIISGFVL